MAATPIELFCLYAPEDKTWVEAFQKHLADLRRTGIISSWYDGLLAPGLLVESQRLQHLNSANIILLFVTANFLANDQRMEQDLPRALERARTNEALVIPLIVDHCNWNAATFANLQPLPADGRPLADWPNPDKALTHVVKAITSHVQERHVPAMKTLPHNLPSRNPLFTGRADELEALHDALHKHKETILTQAISGLGGIGKTQTALEYAYRYQHDYSRIVWLGAESRELLVSGIALLARSLNLPGSLDLDTQLLVQSFLTWLSNQRAWLLILDNVNDLALVREYTPKSSSGHILLTTRKQSVGGSITRIALDELSEETGAYFLLKRAKRIEPDTLLKEIDPQELKLAQQLSDLLGGLPLALDQAGGYIERTQCGLPRYIQLYQKAHQHFLSQPGNPEDTSSYLDTVATTWSISFEAIAKEPLGPAATDLLRFCAFLAPDDILLEIFEVAAEELGPQLGPVAANAIQFEEIVALLLRYSLINRDEYTLSLHRLVQTVLRDGLKPYSEEWLTWAKRTIQVMLEVFPSPDNFDAWNLAQSLFPHMIACTTWIEKGQIRNEASALLLNQSGGYLQEKGLYEEVEPLHKLALEIWRAVLGEQHPDTAASLNNLAGLYCAQGKYEQAEPLYKLALEINQAVLREQHPDMAASLNNLGLLYQEQGKYGQAEPLYKQALEIRQAVLGEQHPDMAASLNNLANLYCAQGKYEQALPLYEQALQIRQAVLGEQHPDMAQSLNNLASLYCAQGKHEKVEPLLERALQIVLQRLGKDHPATQLVAENYFALKERMEEGEEN